MIRRKPAEPRAPPPLRARALSNVKAPPAAGGISKITPLLFLLLYLKGRVKAEGDKTAICEQNRTRLPNVQALEDRILATAPHLSKCVRDTAQSSLPTEFKAEMEAFLTKFKAQLLEAGWCALNLKRDRDAWKRKVLYLQTYPGSFSLFTPLESLEDH
ncbi:hypothetical protein OBBRIDRAFT_832186 [Obba rivulosa]|uniref:Uncharacterized protein n=1 Tax=Obba rivulosa TaxID=1052685 RepID=A0A8E2J3J4_9APHY|nr:hypothetical protein OBBRIDRAFT_832186 [Obba rivulosa]